MTSRSRSKAIAHFERTGLILPGAQGEVAAYLASRDTLRDEENAGRSSRAVTEGGYK